MQHTVHINLIRRILPLPRTVPMYLTPLHRLTTATRHIVTLIALIAAIHIVPTVLIVVPHIAIIHTAIHPKKATLHLLIA